MNNLSRCVDFEPSQTGGGTMGGPLPVPKLTATTFLPWKRQLTMLLKVKGLARAIERKSEEEIDEMTDMQAMLLILGTCDDAHRIQLQGEASAKSMMDSLELQYSDRSDANKYRLLGAYMRAVKVPNQTINQHIGRMKEMRAQLASVGEDQTDGAFQVALIMSLPTEYGDVMHDWDLLHASMKTTEFLVSFLQNREKQLAIKSPSALTVQTPRKAYELMSIEEKKKVTSCKICRKKGHWGRECPQNTENIGEQTRDRATTHVALSLGNLSQDLSDKWLLDSGASSHMSNSSTSFSSLKYLPSPKLATVGNGEKVQIVAVGEVTLRSSSAEGTIILTLHNVSYIPELATNLLSVGAAAKKGIRTMFSNDQCTMSLEGTTIAKGKLLEDTLYVLDLVPMSPRITSLVVNSNAATVDVHETLGHPGRKIIDQVMHDVTGRGEQVVGSEQTSCGSCVAGKGTRASHPASTQNHVNNVGDRVHLDLGAYPLRVSTAFGYFLLAKDEFSEFTFVYNLKSKSETALMIARLIIDFEVQSGKQIKTILSDNGTEFLNRNTELLFLKEKISHNLSAPYCPQQNGTAEREIRSIKEKARTMLIDSGLGPELAHEAMVTACYVKNRLPTYKSEISPFQRFTGRTPNITNLVRFGAKVQAINNASYLTAFEPRTLNGYLVGYTNRINTFRIYLPDNRRVIETCDVIFADHYKKNNDLTQKTADSCSFDTIVDIRNQKIHPQNEYQEQEMGESLSWDHELTTRVEEQRASTPLVVNPPPSKKTITGAELDNFFQEFRVCSSRGVQEASESNQTAEHCPSDIEPPSLSTISGADESDETLTNDMVDQTVREVLPPELPPRTYPRALCVRQLDNDDPTSYDHAVNGPNQLKWREAINEELDAHSENGTWAITSRPLQGTTLTARWIFTTKKNILGEVERYKARLVARGFEQVHGRDFFETFAPVSRIETIRMVLAMIASFDMKFIQFDVATAFLNGIIEEDIFMEAPPGVDISEESCLKLVKALYGLKQAPRAWNTKLTMELSKLGFKPTESDPCLFTNPNKRLMVLIYVDDGLIVGNDHEECLELFTALSSMFKLKRLSGNKFVGLEITKTPVGLSISQEQYTLETLERFEMDEIKPTTSPVTDIRTIVANKPEMELNDEEPYKELLGCLMYLANTTRPDILYVVNWLARFTAKPMRYHWHGLVQVLRYLKGTSNYSLNYRRGIRDLRIYSDADHASPLSQRYSTSGVIVFMADGPIIFSSRKQTAIAQSSTESEYIAANEAIKEAAWLQQMLLELEVKLKKPVLFIDNQSTIKQIKNGDTKRRSKHVELRYHYVRKQFQDGLFDLEYVETNRQPADLLTKPLGGKRLQELTYSERILLPLHRTMRSGNRIKTPFAGALFCIMMFLTMFCGMASTLGFKPVDTKLWTSTEKTVSTGIVSQRIEYFVLSPCSLAHISSWDSEQDVKRKSFEQLKDECQAFFDSNIKKTLKEVADCTSPSGPDTALVKSKKTKVQKLPKARRRRAAVIAIAAAMTIVALGSSIVQAAYSEWSPNSSHNRLNSLQARVETLERVNKLIEKTQESAFEIRDSLIGNLTILHNRVEGNKRAIDQLTKSSASVSWNAADLRVNLEHLNDQLQEIGQACEDRTIAPGIYSELFRLPQLKALKRKDTILDTVEMTEKGVLIIDFYYDRQPNDTKIYKIEPIMHYVNVTTDPVLVEYVGPPFLLYNETSDCTLGLRDSEFHDGRTTRSCERDGWYDSHLNLWAPVEFEDESSESRAKPQVYRTKKATIVYCLYHNIIIWGKELLCPHYPFELSLKESFILPNLSHVVQQQIMERTQFVSRITTPDLDIHGTDADYMRETKALQALKEKNDLSIRAGIFNVEKSTLTIPVNLSTLFYSLGVAGTLITIVTFVKGVLCRPSSLQPSETTNVNIFNEQVPLEQETTHHGDHPRRYPSIGSFKEHASSNHYYANQQQKKTHHYMPMHTLRGSVESV